MSLASPPWLLATLAAIVALLLLWRAADRRRRAALAAFAAPQLLGDLTATLSPRRRAAKRALIAVGVGLAGLALAGPQLGFTWEETRRRGIDVLIALDTSRSMLAQDVAPNRLERAKLAVRDLLAKLGSDRVGLIAFAGSAFLQVPLTLDHAAFLESLDALQPGVIPAPGSDIASALATAEKALATEQRNVKILVLISDGEDLGGGALAAAKQAAEAGIRVFTVGVGSDTGELIPLPSADGGTEFLKGPDGQYVKSRLDADTLRQVAELTGGFYEPLGRRGEGIEAIYERALAPLPKEELASRMRRVPIERFQWPLALAILLLAIEPLVRERRSRRRGDAALVLALLVLAASVVPADAASVREAQRLYEQGEYEQALEEYRAAVGESPTPQVEFNLGAAAYKAGEFGDAAAAFARALGSDDPALQEQGFYNLGNAQFRLGQQMVEKSPQQTMQAWQQALDSYDQALALDPEDQDARFNREYVQRALEQLQQQQQQQQQQDQNQQNDQQQNDENEKQQDQQQGEQQDSSQGEQSPEQQQGEQQHEPQQQDQKDQQSQSQSGDEPQPSPSPQQGGREREPSDEQRQPQDQPRPADGRPQGDQQPQDGQQQASGTPPPGQMSPDEARDLLDSLKDGEATLQELDRDADKKRGRSREERDW